MTAADEILAVENMDVLKRNGFEVVQDDEEDGRLHLVAQPVSKDIIFDMKGCTLLRQSIMIYTNIHL